MKLVHDVHHVDSLSQFIYSPDPLSRFQYEKVHGAKQDQADHEAVKMLMLAVLEDGIACFQDYFFQPSRTNEKLFHEADEWIHSNDDGVFSFNNICESLGLCPEKLRKGLAGWRAKQKGVSINEENHLILNKGKRGRRKIYGSRTATSYLRKANKGLASPLRLNHRKELKTV